MSTSTFAVRDGVWISAAAASSVWVVAMEPGDSRTGSTGEVTWRPYNGGLPTGLSRMFIGTLCRCGSGKWTGGAGKWSKAGMSSFADTGSRWDTSGSVVGEGRTGRGLSGVWSLPVFAGLALLIPRSVSLFSSSSVAGRGASDGPIAIGRSVPGRSSGTFPIHPPSQRECHSPRLPIWGEDLRTLSQQRAHSASASLARLEETLQVTAACLCATNLE